MPNCELCKTPVEEYERGEGMKTIELLQSQIGRFDLCSNEESFSFSLGIKDDGKIFEVNEVKAILQYSGDPYGKENFDYAWDNGDIGWIFRECFNYASRIISTRDYRAQCLLFAKTYSHGFCEISENFERIEKEKIKKKIESLSKKLESDLSLYCYEDDIKECLSKEINKYSKWIASTKDELNQVKEGTDKFKEISDKIVRYESKINKLSILDMTEVTNAKTN